MCHEIQFVRDNCPTIDEVNTFLAENYVLKTEFNKLKQENEQMKTSIAELKAFGGNSSGGLFTLSNQIFTQEELTKNGWELLLTDTDEVLSYMGWRLEYSIGTIQLITINYWSPKRHHLLLYLDTSEGTEIATLEIKSTERLLIINGKNQFISSSDIQIYEDGDETYIVDIPETTATTLKLKYKIQDLLLHLMLNSD